MQVCTQEFNQDIEKSFKLTMPATIQLHSHRYVTVPGFWMKSHKPGLERFYKAMCNNVVSVIVGTKELEQMKEYITQCLTCSSID